MKTLSPLPLLLTLLLSMVGTKVYAHDIAVPNTDGKTIYYVWTNNKTELQVSYSGGGSNEYSGNVVIPDSVTYNGNTYAVTSIGDHAFSGYSGLISVTIPNSVTSIGHYAFSGCHSLTSVAIPNSVTSIGEGVFEECRSLTSVTIPHSVKSIGYVAFYGCTSLTFLTIGNSVTSIDEGAFHNCSSLTSVIIPNSVTQIGEDAFQGCSSLRIIVIGKVVKTIYKYAFKDCENLNDVYCYCVRYPQTENNAFEGSYPDYVTLHVPAEAVEQYRKSVPWSDFREVVSLRDGDPRPNDNYSSGGEKCATPTISYFGKKLTFGCRTEGVEYVYEINDTDIKLGYDSEVVLTATYEISVYATKAGYENSDVATATLVWNNATFTETTGSSSVRALTREVAALITSHDGIITVSSEGDGQPVAVYDVGGQRLGMSTVRNGQATINTTLQSGSIAIVKVVEKAVKVVVK